MRKTPAKVLGAFCAALLAVNSAAISVFAEEDIAPAPSGDINPIIFNSSDDSVLYWATQIGTDTYYWSDAPTGFSVGDNGFIYICSADSIYKLDKFTGKIVGSAKMEGKAEYATKGPKYADGRVFMALDNGMIEAFNADTLEPLWIYNNKLGGKPTCDIVYNNGCIYTGFWNSEIADADFVCIDVTTDGETGELSTKTAKWEVTNPGGYYWTTPAFIGDTVYIGKDNGSEDKTVTDSEQTDLIRVDDSGNATVIGGLIGGDVRSKLVSYGNELLFTSKDGVFYAFSTDDSYAFKYPIAEDLGLDGFTCTSTPVAANGRVYITLGAPWGDSRSSVVVVLEPVKDDIGYQIAYTVETAAHCQVEGIFAGVDENGYNVVYYVENGMPGTVRVLRDKAGMYHPYETVEETDYSGNVHQYLPAVFTPQGAHANYCSVDPVFDPETGLIYIRNDSFNILAIGPAVKSVDFYCDDITIHQNGVPTLVYKADQTPTDCECVVGVEGGYTANVEDLYENIAFSVDRFTTDDEVLTVTYTAGLYNGSGAPAVVTCDVNVLVAETDDQYNRALAQKGDVNGDGVINVTDISLVAANVKNIKAIDKYSRNAADVNCDGSINVTDVSAVAANVKGIAKINSER